MGRSTVIFAYADTDVIPVVGTQRVSYACAYADGSKGVEIGQRDDALDGETLRDIFGKRLVLFVILGRDILGTAANITWFEAFLHAPFRWAVFGNFKDTANVANANLCRCNPEEDEVDVSIINDLENGMTLLSDKIF
ncbi:MAG: hypothetical protein IMZ53_12925 [Thermoplasmata archaeon]|nr:hypothetical protein [Thermoplasmata archaeon]